MEDKNEKSVLSEEKDINSINIEYKDKKDYPPRSITIGKYYYTYKDKNKLGFSYRCKYKTICNYTMTIDEDNLNKIINKTSEKINYKSTSKKYPIHSCLKNINGKSLPDSDNNISNIIIDINGLTKKELEKTASLII